MSARRWVLRSLASAAGLAMLAGAALAQAPAAQEKPAALVNGTAISMADVDALLKQGGPTATPLTELQKRQMRMEAVSMLIDDALLQQFLSKNSPPVDQAQVNEQIGKLQNSLKMQGKTLQDFYKESGQTAEQLRQNVSTMIQWAGYVKAHLSDADIRHYYDENRDFFDRIAVRASHIVLRVPQGASATERQAVRARLRALRQEILAGKISFADAARKYSQCSSAPGGGDIGYFPRKLAVEESFSKAAFALKPNEISDVVETDYGMHLIMVTDRKQPETPSVYEKVKEEVRELCIEEMRMSILAGQRRLAKIEINLPEK